MAHCSQLSINERKEIRLGLAKGFSKNCIALSLGRSSLVQSVACGYLLKQIPTLIN